MLEKAKLYASRPYVLLALLFVLAIIISIIHFYRNDYNNYSIFITSFKHLLEGKNLNLFYPDEYNDQFLYAPPSAVLFAPFYFLPISLGLIVWNIVTVIIFFYAILKLPIIQKNKIFILWFTMVELATSLHNFQTNPFLVGFILLAFAFIECQEAFKSGMLTACNFFVKGYAGFMVLLYPFYPKFIKNTLFMLLSLVLVGISPAIFVGFKPLIFHYQNWLNCLIADHKLINCCSIIGLIQYNISDKIPIGLIQIFGILGLLLVWARSYFFLENNFNLRLMLLSYLLMWVILFNHAGESSTYIFAVMGVALWYCNAPKSRINLILIIVVFVFTSLIATDIFPKNIRIVFLESHALKALPILLVWIKWHVDFFKIPFFIKAKTDS